MIRKKIWMLALSALALFGSSVLCQAGEETVLKLDHQLELEYAEQFQVSYYEDDYIGIDIADGQHLLLIPEGKDAPEGLKEDYVFVKKPVDNIYLAATSAMDYFRALDSIDRLRLSGTKETGWYIEEAVEAMERGDLIYAGNYSAPDYEQILLEGSSLAIESTMIYHSPEVMENLQKFGIPVLVEHSSYESSPLGRMEWIKLYGVLLGKEDLAEQVYADLTDSLDEVMNSEQTGKTVAFFYLNSRGMVNVRKSNDYISKMIQLAGGTYIFSELAGEDENALSTMNMQMEEFYAKGKDADYLIYNSTIDGELETIEDLLAKNVLLADFKAVKEDHVWCTGKNLFQESTGLGVMIKDLHAIVTGEAEDLEQLTFLHRLR